MAALEAMSDSDDEEIPESQWNTKAKNLAQAIESGKFDHLVNALENDGESEDEIEEVILGDSSDEEDADGQDTKKSGGDSEEVENDDEDEDSDSEDDGESGSSEEEEVKSGKKKPINESDDSDNEEEESAEVQQQDKEDEDDEDDEEEEEEEDEEDDKIRRMKVNNMNNSKALSVVTADLVAAHAHLPWAETFDVVPPTPLPFGQKGDGESSPLDIHDDLKREVAFYDSALEAVNIARSRCKKAGIPFSRPEDFFAEMVKTDGEYLVGLCACIAASLF